MSNKNKRNATSATAKAATPATEATPNMETKNETNTTGKTEAEPVDMNDIEVKLPLGRPINENSERQKRLASYAAKTAEGGTLRRGRPSDPDSENAKKKMARDARIAELKTKAIEARNAGVNNVEPKLIKNEKGELEPHMVKTGDGAPEIVS